MVVAAGPFKAVGIAGGMGGVSAHAASRPPIAVHRAAARIRPIVAQFWVAFSRDPDGARVLMAVVRAGPGFSTLQ